MAKLVQKGALEFNMIYHVDSNQFERVEILDSVSKRTLVSEAQFEVASAHHHTRQRGASPEGGRLLAAADVFHMHAADSKAGGLRRNISYEELLKTDYESSA